MERPLDVRSARRVKFVGRIAVFWALAIAGKLIYVQMVKHEDYAEAARSQQQHVYSIPALRGEITDRRGAPLALSIQTQSVAVNPRRVKDPASFAQLVGHVLSMDAGELEREIVERQERARKDKSARGRSYLMIKRHITKEEASRLKRLWCGDILEILRDMRREYPGGMLAAHVVGSLDSEGRGNSGIEQKLETELRGRSGRMRVLTDSRLSRYVSWIEDHGEQGTNLRLSIHRTLQHDSEQALAKGVAAASAKGGSVVVMDPHTGEILALANYPSFDPRVLKPGTRKEFEARRNLAVSTPVEPGSVMKMITVTMGLDTGKFNETTPIYCENGRFPRPGRKPLTDLHPYGGLDLSLVLIKSSNIGVAKISIACGPKALNDYLGAFGMGKRTGIELPGETRGLLGYYNCPPPKPGMSAAGYQEWKRVNCWSASSHEYMAFGHEIGATALQLARAVSVIANGGLLVQPRLIAARQYVRPSGVLEEEAAEHPAPRRVLRAETAHTVRRIMERVVVEGTGKRARLAGYTSGGKTGSAEIFQPGFGWVNRHNSSFIGFSPVINPRIVVVVTINDTALQGGIAAAPVFKEVAAAALRILNVPKDDLESDIKPGAELPADRMEPAKVEPLRIAEAKEPEPEEPAAPPAVELLAGPRVPDFRGKNVLAVLRESATLHLPVEIVGRGIARDQKPGPGEILPAGGKVQVEFARP